MDGNGGRLTGIQTLLDCACETCGYVGKLVSVEEKGCFGVVLDSYKDRRSGWGENMRPLGIIMKSCQDKELLKYV